MNAQTLARRAVIKTVATTSPAAARAALNQDYNEWFEDMQTNPAKYEAAIHAHVATLSDEDAALLWEGWALIQAEPLPFDLFAEATLDTEQAMNVLAWIDKAETTGAAPRIIAPLIDPYSSTIPVEHLERIHELAYGESLL